MPMRLFKREKKSPGSPCPRCSQLVDDNQMICPMCGWDVRDAYQGPSLAHEGADRDGADAQDKVA
jgi:hypothetical protein